MEFRNVAFHERLLPGNQTRKACLIARPISRTADCPVKNMLPRYVPLVTSSHFEIFQHKVPREYIKIRLGIWLTGFALYYEVLAKALEYISTIRNSS